MKFAFDYVEQYSATIIVESSNYEKAREELADLCINGEMKIEDMPEHFVHWEICTNPRYGIKPVPKNEDISTYQYVKEEIDKEKFKSLYEVLKLLSSAAPEEDECTDKENEIYADIANLICSLRDVIDEK